LKRKIHILTNSVSQNLLNIKNGAKGNCRNNYGIGHPSTSERSYGVVTVGLGAADRIESVIMSVSILHINMLNNSCGTFLFIL
jgi:hypothetical protein